jgi:hypothetical protein
MKTNITTSNFPINTFRMYFLAGKSLDETHYDSKIDYDGWCSHIILTFMHEGSTDEEISIAMVDGIILAFEERFVNNLNLTRENLIKRAKVGIIANLRKAFNLSKILTLDIL